MAGVETGTQIEIVDAQETKTLGAIAAEEGEATGVDGVDEEDDGEKEKESASNQRRQ